MKVTIRYFPFSDICDGERFYSLFLFAEEVLNFNEKAPFKWLQKKVPLTKCLLFYSNKDKLSSMKDIQSYKYHRVRVNVYIVSLCNILLYIKKNHETTHTSE